MKPVIFPSDATEFTTQGWGPITCISCEVEEERNGIYELTARIPFDSPRFDKLVEGNIIVATHSNRKDRQPFQIYSVSKTIDGLAEVKAEHISYRLNKIVTMPFEAAGIQAALNGLKNNATEDCPFTFWTDKESTVTYKPKVPKTIKASLAGSDGSIIDTFSAGDYEFDVFAVKFWADRGADNGVTVRYGKNLTDLEKETDISDIYTAIVPYWTGQDAEGNEMTVMLSSTPANNVVQSEYVDYFPTARTVAVDFADKFQDPPTAEQLRAAAVTYLNENARRQLFTTITASFIELSQTDQYKDYYALESVNLCDTVTVVHPLLKISDKLRVTRVVYDVLADRNKEVTLGDLKRTLANVIGNKEQKTTFANRGVTDYTKIKESTLPKINGVTLKGNVSLEDIGIHIPAIRLIQKRVTVVINQSTDTWFQPSVYLDMEGYYPLGVYGVVVETTPPGGNVLSGHQIVAIQTEKLGDRMIAYARITSSEINTTNGRVKALTPGTYIVYFNIAYIKNVDYEYSSEWTPA